MTERRKPHLRLKYVPGDTQRLIAEQRERQRIAKDPPTKRRRKRRRRQVEREDGDVPSSPIGDEIECGAEEFLNRVDRDVGREPS